MSTSINSSGVTFPDGTTQTTAVSGTGVPSTYTGVGSTIAAISSYAAAINPGDTISGAYLFYITFSTSPNYYNTFTPQQSPAGDRRNQTTSFTSGYYTFNNIGTGTWLMVGGQRTVATAYDPCAAGSLMAYALFRRIS